MSLVHCGHLLHRSGIGQVLGGVCLGPCCSCRATLLLEAGLLFVVSRPNVSLFVHYFLAETRGVRREGHRRVILRGQLSQQRVVD